MPTNRRSTPDRRTKWWLLSEQQWFNIILFLVWSSAELLEYFKNRDTAGPSWLMEALTVVGLLGNMALRAWKHDNERLTLRKDK